MQDTLVTRQESSPYLDCTSITDFSLQLRQLPLCYTSTRLVTHVMYVIAGLRQYKPGSPNSEMLRWAQVQPHVLRARG